MDLKALKDKIEQMLASIHSMEDLRRVKVALLGRKGLFPDYYEQLKTRSLEERRLAGREINSLKNWTETRLGEVEAAYAAEEQQKKAQDASIDITLPGKKPVLGRLHPITLVFDEIIRIFSSLGFSVAEGPDIELEYYNFEALNIPKDHPARDMQDTFYVRPDVVLRTHTSPVQIRTMEHDVAPHTDHRARRGLPPRPGHLPHPDVPPGRRPDGRQEREVLRPQGRADHVYP